MLVDVRDVSKQYGPVRALEGLTAAIDGRVIGLLGPNGAGKSTLLKVLLGLISFDGYARVLGFDPARDSFAIRDRVGYMPESDSFLPNMNAVELCAYAGELSGLPRTEAMQRAHAALHYANLGDKRYLPVEGYSTGLKQRVKLAQALVHDPELLFLDEPTNGLDPGGRDEMLELVADLPRRRDLSVVISTHLLPDVEKVCDHVIVMAQGKLLFAGSLDALRGDAAAGYYELRIKVESQPFVDALVQAGCQVKTERERLWITLPASADTGLVLAAARATGAQIRHMAPARQSLEDAFLRTLDA